MSGLDYRYFFPQVLQAVPSDDYLVYAYFNDGSVRLYDAKPLLKKDTVFEPLMDIQTFKNTLTVMNDTIAWDIEGKRDPYKCIDIDPLTIFEKERVTDPLEKVSSV